MQAKNFEESNLFLTVTLACCNLSCRLRSCVKYKQIMCLCVVPSERPITDSTEPNRTDSGIGSDRFGSVEFADSTEPHRFCRTLPNLADLADSTDSYRFLPILPILTDSYRFLPIFTESCRFYRFLPIFTYLYYPVNTESLTYYILRRILISHIKSPYI